MRVVVAPDSFGGTLSAHEAATAMTDGWREVAPYDEVVALPMSDGGRGFVDVIAAARSAELTVVDVSDPLGRQVEAHFLVLGQTAYVEVAQACGLHLLAVEERDPMRAHTRGVGQLLHAADRDDVTRIVVGLGGTGTNDGGAGMWDELDGRAPTAALVAATDVDNPLLGVQGASAVFGPQKGADRAMVLDLDDRLRAWADRVEAATGLPGLRDVPGAGAAGGLGFALLAWGAERVPGFDTVAEVVGLPDAVADADLVITGEGSFDAQSLRGKVPTGVARLALEAGAPCVVVAGQVSVGTRDAAAHGISETISVADVLGSVESGLAAGADGVRQAAARLARRWGRSG